MFVFKYFPGLESICLKFKYFQEAWEPCVFVKHSQLEKLPIYCSYVRRTGDTTQIRLRLDKHKTSICTSTEDITAKLYNVSAFCNYSQSGCKNTTLRMPPFVARSKTSELWAIRDISVQGQKTSCTTAVFSFEKTTSLENVSDIYSCQTSWNLSRPCTQTHQIMFEWSCWGPGHLLSGLWQL